MNAYLVRSVGVACAVLAASTWAGTSLAQGEAGVTPAAATSAPAETITRGYNGPNRAMLGSGVALLGMSYIPAVVIAAQSPQAADSKLYYPVAGPWLDLAERPSNAPGAAGSPPGESSNRALIAVDGAFQGLGSLLMIGSFIVQEHQTVVTTAKVVDAPQVHFSPARLGPGGYGVSAFGSF